ncbi:MAG: hypothetical protein ACXW18_00835 [Pyrinomonadaceae bacterium]
MDFILRFFEREKRLMFAKSSSQENYHLLQADEEQTLCGHPVVPIIIDRPVKVTALHLTSIQPDGHELCELCARARVEEQS